MNCELTLTRRILQFPHPFFDFAWTRRFLSTGPRFDIAAEDMADHST